MSIINKTLLIAIALITAILSFSTSFVPVAYATEQGKDACEIAGYNDPTICGHKNKNNEQELQNRVRSILNTVYLWIGIIATIVIIIAGIFYMISLGDAAKIQRAKNAIIYAIIGLIVTLAAFAITNLVINALEGRH